MEFAEVREYKPGDDVRTIDWNVTARMGAPYVKQFVEERDLTLLLLVDLSGSQAFGSRILKRDFAAELAAVLAFSAVANHDRVGAVLFTDRVESYVPPGARAATTRCASCATCSPSSRGARHRPRAARCASPARHEAPRHRRRDLRLPGRGLRAGAGHPARAATT